MSHDPDPYPDLMPVPKEYAGLTPDQAFNRLFYNRVRECDGLGVSLREQMRFHQRWGEAKTIQERQKVLQDIQRQLFSARAKQARRVSST